MNTKPSDHGRRRLLAIGVAAAAAPWAATAQAPFNRPVKLVLGTAPGGSVDALARKLALHLAPALGVPVVVENKPGGSNKIAMDYVANSPPDGHTLMLVGSSTPLVGGSRGDQRRDQAALRFAARFRDDRHGRQQHVRPGRQVGTARQA